MPMYLSISIYLHASTHILTLASALDGHTLSPSTSCRQAFLSRAPTSVPKALFSCRLIPVTRCLPWSHASEPGHFTTKPSRRNNHPPLLNGHSAHASFVSSSKKEDAHHHWVQTCQTYIHTSLSMCIRQTTMTRNPRSSSRRAHFPSPPANHQAVATA
jgi:hypothetical protein